MYRFLVSGRWIAGFLVCVLFSLLCVYLAGWQMDRKEALDHRNSLISENYDARPLEGQAALAQFERFDPDRQWTPARVQGQYLPEHQVLVRNRPHEGAVGFEVLVPLRTTDGEIVVIDRGWVPAGDSNAAPAQAVPAPPSGTVQVTARLHAGEPSTDRSAPAGQIQSVDLPDYARQTGLDLAEAAYGIMASEDPAPAQRPQQLSAPEQSAGPNLSYSLQWYSFAVLVYVAYGWCARQKVRNDRLDAQLAEELQRRFRSYYAEDGTYIGTEDEAVVRRQMEMIDDMPPHMKSIVRPKLAKARSRPTDAEEEDALLDAMARSRGADPADRD